ncbi:MAG: tyrosine-type recombinase/integrase [Desulfatiglans sp.]|nr:tyrosine-type recombinase/integrase [Desulfatiglans sp.]
MAILQECFVCHKKQAVKNKVCLCGQDLDAAKKSKKIKYWISYRMPDGKQKRESVSAYTDLDGYSIMDARKALSKREVQKSENRILDVKKESKWNFNQLAEWYLSLDSIKGLSSAWRVKLALGKFNSVFGDTLVSNIQLEDLENYQAMRKAEELAPATIDQEMGAAKAMVYKAWNNEKVSGDILRKFKLVKKQLKAGANVKDEVLSVSEAYALIDNCSDFLKPITITAYHTGMRRSEVLGLKRSHLNMREGLIQLKAEDTKNGRPRTIPMNKELLNLFRKMPVNFQSEYLFLFKGQPVYDVRASFQAAVKKTGLAYGRKGGLTFHSIRHTVNTDMRRAGIHQSVIQAIMGHEDHSMFARYNTVDVEDLKRAAERLEEYRQEKINVDHSVDQAVENEK